MVHRQFRKGKVTTWLLPVVLVLSLLSFSGVSNSSASRHFRPTTEQVEHFRNSRTQHVSFSATDAEILSHVQRASHYQAIAFKYARAVQVQVRQCSRHFLVPIVFYQVPHSSVSTTEGFSISQIG